MLRKFFLEFPTSIAVNPAVKVDTHVYPGKLPCKNMHRSMFKNGELYIQNSHCMRQKYMYTFIINTSAALEQIPGSKSAKNAKENAEALLQPRKHILQCGMQESGRKFCSYTKCLGELIVLKYWFKH